MNGSMQGGDEKDLRRATGAVLNRGFSGENRHPALRIQEDHDRDRDNFHRDGDTNMRHGPPDTEENFQRFRDDGGRRDRDNMRRGADDRWRTPDAFGRKDDRPPSPREDRLRDGDDLRRNYRPAPPREDRLRDGDDFRRDYRPAPLRKDGLRDGDDFRRNYRPTPPREDRLRDGDDFRRDYRPAPLRKDRLRDGDDFRRDYKPALLRKDTLRDKDDFRQDYRPTPPREDRFRDGDDFRRDFRRTPPRKDRLRDRDDIQKRDDVDSGFRRGIVVNDLRRLGVGPTAGRDRDDEFRRRDDGGQRMVRGSDLSMGGEDGTPSIDNRDRDNFRPSQSNFRMQGNEKHDDTRKITGFGQRDLCRKSPPIGKERDRDRDSFMPARGSKIGALRASLRGSSPSDSCRDGGNYGRFRLGGDDLNRSEPQSATQTGQFRPPDREEKKNGASFMTNA